MIYPPGYIESFTPDPSLHTDPGVLKQCPVCNPKPKAESASERPSEGFTSIRVVHAVSCTTGRTSEEEAYRRRRR